MPSQTITEDTQQKAQCPMQRTSLRVLVVSALITLFELIGGCAALPSGVQRPVSQAVVDERTSLAQAATAAMPAGAAADLSGLRLLPDGDQALDARLALARHAERTLDVQLLPDRPTTPARQFLRALRDAAARGVRVRLLVDDLHSADVDALLAGLAAHDQRRGAAVQPAAGAQRLADDTAAAQPMHSSSSCTGACTTSCSSPTAMSPSPAGATSATSTSCAASAANFVDMDILATGAVLRELARSSSATGTATQAYPLRTLQPRRRRRARERFDAAARRARRRPRRRGARPAWATARSAAQLDDGHWSCCSRAVQVLADAPDKVVRRRHAGRQRARPGPGRLREARSEVVIVSPYFIPGVRGMAMLREATAARRARRRADQLAGRHRRAAGAPRLCALPRGDARSMGVTIHELSPGLSRKAGVARATSAPPTAGCMPRWRWSTGAGLLMGSMNMDGRSALANTELGLLIDSRELAAEAAELFRAGAQGATLPPAAGRRRAHRMAGHRRRP